jgi:hypothetical protein
MVEKTLSWSVVTLSVAPLYGGHNRFGDGADLESSAALFDFKGDRRSLDRYNFAHQLRQVRHRTTELPGPYIQQCVLLQLASLMINENGDTPITLQDVSRDLADEANAQP